MNVDRLMERLVGPLLMFVAIPVAILWAGGVLA